jgi:hypothetical protein
MKETGGSGDIDLNDYPMDSMAVLLNESAVKIVHCAIR